MRFGFFLLFAATLSAADIPIPITITAPWARATAPSAINGAIFAEIANSGTAADELTAASVAPTIADHVELHAHTKDAQGVMHMAPVPSVTIPAGGKAELKPGSFHIMVFGLKHPLIEGQHIPVTLTFAHAGRIEATAMISTIAATEAPATGSAAGATDCCAPAQK